MKYPALWRIPQEQKDIVKQLSGKTKNVRGVQECQLFCKPKVLRLFPFSEVYDSKKGRFKSSPVVQAILKTPGLLLKVFPDEMKLLEKESP